MTGARTAQSTPEGGASGGRPAAQDAAAGTGLAAIDLVGVAKEFSARRGSVAAVCGVVDGPGGGRWLIYVAGCWGERDNDARDATDW